MSAVDLTLTDPQTLVAKLAPDGQALTEIRDYAAVSEAVFAAQWQAPIWRLADWLQELPAHHAHHRGPAGALRYALHAGALALRLAEGAMFTPASGAEERRRLEPIYRRAAFLGCLASILPLPLNAVHVRAAGLTWSDVHHPAGLGEWLRSHGATAYAVEWRTVPQPHARMMASYLAAHLFAKDFASDDSPREVWAEWLAGLAPDPLLLAGETPLQGVIRKALRMAAEADSERARQAFTSSDQVSGIVAPPSGAPRSRGAVAEGETPATNPEPVTAVTTPTNGVTPLKEGKPFLRNLLQALAQDVAKGGQAAKRVRWERDGLAVSTALIGEYGIATGAVVAALREVGAIKRKDGQAIVLAESLGEAISPRSGTSG